VPVENINPRHTVTSLLLIIALALLGFHGQSSQTRSSPRDRAVFHTAQKPQLTLRSVGAKAYARKAPEPFSTHLICPGTHAPTPELHFGFSRKFWTFATSGGSGHLGDLHGRAPPAIG